MKKIISVFFAALLFVSALMLSSCGNTDGEKDFPGLDKDFVIQDLFRACFFPKKSLCFLRFNL